MANLLKHLFSPIRVKKMEIPNRIVMPPMGTRYPTYGGAVTSKLIDYYVERARGAGENSPISSSTRTTYSRVSWYGGIPP